MCSLCAYQAFIEVLPGLRDTKQGRRVSGLMEGDHGELEWSPHIFSWQAFPPSLEVTPESSW